MTEIPLSYLELLCCLGSEGARDVLCEAEDVRGARFYIQRIGLPPDPQCRIYIKSSW